MTVAALIRKLTKISNRVGPRATVVVRLEEFRLVGEEFSHWGIHDVEDESIPWTFPTRELSDGSERMKVVVSIK